MPSPRPRQTPTIESAADAVPSSKRLQPAYLPKLGSPLTVDRAVYDAIQAAPRLLQSEFELPIRSGRAWEVPAGSIVRISTPQGPQVGKSSSSWQNPSSPPAGFTLLLL